LVGAEAVVCVFSALSLIFVYILMNRLEPESHLTSYFLPSVSLSAEAEVLNNFF
jgi:hypothetical protein